MGDRSGGGAQGLEFFGARIKARSTAPQFPFTPAHFLDGSALLAPAPLPTIRTRRHTLLHRKPMAIITHEHSAGLRGPFSTRLHTPVSE